MNGLKKSLTFCLTLSVIHSAMAGNNAPFAIKPNITSASISDQATGLFRIEWTITNLTTQSTALTTPLPSWNSTLGDKTNDGIPDLSTFPGTKVLSSTCNKNIEPGDSCVITTGTYGPNVQNNFLFSLPVSGFGNQLSAQAPANERVNMVLNHNPIPEGSWKTLATISQETFPEFVTLDNINYQFAIGLNYDDNSSPWVIRCQISNPDLCNVPFKGLIDHHFSRMTNLSFDKEGNLYGLFIEPSEDAPWKNKTYLMKLAQNTDTWSVFGDIIEGTAAGLDASDPENILISAQQTASFDPKDKIALAKMLNTSGNNLYLNRFLDSTNFQDIINDGQGHFFVAGPVVNPDDSIQSHSKIWQWDPIQETFTEISMPDNIPLITDLVSNGKGLLYISGLNIFGQGQVWSYDTTLKTFESMNINASYITTLEYSPYGYLLAGGVDNTTYKGTIWYYHNQEWIDLNLPNSTNVASIASNANNDIFATGFTSRNQAAVWLYNTIDTPKG